MDREGMREEIESWKDGERLVVERGGQRERDIGRGRRYKEGDTLREGRERERDIRDIKRNGEGKRYQEREGDSEKGVRAR